jgi:hypothetical protein
MGLCPRNYVPPAPPPKDGDITKVHICRQAFVSWVQAAGLPIHTAQHRDLVAGMTADVSWGDTSQAKVMEIR